jgi:hypothetical protein
MTMPRRLFALALTLATLSAPLTLTLCQVECADAASHDRAAHHSCHEAAAPAAVSMTAVPHACGHTDQEPQSLERAPQMAAAPPAIVPVAGWTPSLVVVARAVPAAIQHSPPGSFQLISQLRV